MSNSDKRLVSALKAVADPTRIKILRLLREKDRCSLGEHEGMCARDIEQAIKLSQPTISHHMSILARTGLVTAKKIGLWMWYRRDEKALRELSRALEGHI